MASQTLVVVGGNGFLGSAVARAAVARGWTVHSLSRSGTPPTMPDGTVPAFTSKVNYHAGSAFDPASYAHLLEQSTAVVHSMGILLEGSAYKHVLKNQAGGALGGLLGLGGNPLERRAGKESDAETGSYETMNRDSALSVLDALRASRPSSSSSSSSDAPTPFVYVSAEDIFRPFVDARYISTKREAEQAIVAACAEQPAQALTTLSAEEKNVVAAAATAPEGQGEAPRAVAPFIVRPGIMTSPTYRPLLAPLGPLLALSAALPPVLPTLLRTFSLSGTYGPAGSLARALETRALDVEEVGEAVCRAIETRRTGVAGVEEIRRLAAEGSVIKENKVW